MERHSAMPMRLCALLLCLLLVALHACGVAARASSTPRWTPEAFPNPQRDVAACGRNGVKSNICDPDGVLSFDGGNLVEGVMNRIAAGGEPYAKAPCGDQGDQGFQVAVAVMRRMYIGAGEDDASAAARFARSVHASWGVGSAACNNGVLLLLATDDRQVYISTGTGAEARLPRPVLLAVMGNMKPALRERRYDEALLEAVHEIGLGLAGADVPGAGDEGGSGVFMFFASVVAAVFGWGWWSNRRQMARYKTCHNRLEALKRDQAALQRGQYASTSCPICLEDFDDAASGGGASTSDAARAGGAEAAGESAPLLASRGDAAAVAGGGDAKGHRPLALRCGHAFCVPCISEWVRGHTTCPVCRRDIDAPDGTSRTPPPPRQPCGDATATAAAQQAGVRARGPARRDIFLPELMFRTQRLRLLYPDYVSDTMAAQFLQDLEEDRPLSPAAFASFEARHPARDAAGRAELRESGRGGASTSFGGGSGGGGGAGSSW